MAQVFGGFRRPEGATPYVHLDELMLVSVLVTGGGLVFACAPGVFLLARLVQQHGRSLAARVGGARAAFDPAAVARVVAGVAVLVFAVGVRIGQSRDARAVSEPTTTLVDVEVSLEDLGSTAPHPLAESVPFVALRRHYVATTDGVGMTSIKASCDDVARFVRGVPRSNAVPSAPFSCEPGTVYWSDGVPRPARSAIAPAARDARTQQMSTSMQRQLEIDRLDTSGADKVSDATTGVHADAQAHSVGGDEVVFRVPRADVAATLSSIYAVAPYSQPSALGLDPVSGLNIAMINGFLRLGLITGCLMALMALLTGLADRATERRRADNELMASGAPAAFVRCVHRWELGIVLGGVLTVAVVAGVLGGWAWQLAGSLIRTPDWSSIGVLLAGTAVAGVMIALGASWVAPRSLDVVALRQE